MTRNILIADDDPAIRTLVSECLTDRFTTCSEAGDGESAVRLAAERKPDVVLLDMDMPLLDGFGVCRALKTDKSTRRIPVVFLTSDADVPDVVRGMDLGAADYITKPFDGDELKARVRSVLRFQRELRAADGAVGRDELTGLLNRAYFDLRVEADLATSRRRGLPLACCVAMVDPGEDPAAGPSRSEVDDVLRVAAANLLAVLRREDVACRYDDRTFAVLAFTADRAAALALADRVQGAVAAALSAASGGHPMPVNVGVALSHYSVGESLVWHATEAMRHAQLSAAGTVQFGGELTEFQLVNGVTH